MSPLCDALRRVLHTEIATLLPGLNLSARVAFFEAGIANLISYVRMHLFKRTIDRPHAHGVLFGMMSLLPSCLGLPMLTAVLGPGASTSMVLSTGYFMPS